MEHVCSDPLQVAAEPTRLRRKLARWFEGLAPANKAFAAFFSLLFSCLGAAARNRSAILV
jgi:hypothetical protein